MKKKLPKKLTRIKPRKEKVLLEDLKVPPINDESLQSIAQSLSRQIEKETFERKYAPAIDVLKLVGAGVFLAASIAVPTLPMAIKPFLNDNYDENKAWKKFNLPYLKRTLRRLEEQKLVETSTENNCQIVKITERGKRRILRAAIDELTITKPKIWDGKWRMISYDIPEHLKGLRQVFREYLRAWRFYPIQESVFLHAYPCFNQVEFLREYLGIGEYVRVFSVSKIENDKLFRDFFDI